jgi:hypothetical protein
VRAALFTSLRAYFENFSKRTHRVAGRTEVVLVVGWARVCVSTYMCATIKEAERERERERERNSYRRQKRAALTCPMFNIARAALFNLLSQFNRNFLLWQGKHAKETRHSAWCSPLLLIITVNLPTDRPARAFALPEQIVQKLLLQATVYFVRGY